MEPKPDAPFSAPVAVEASRGPTVALIDDDNVQLQLYKAQLSKQGAKVTMFKNGKEFLTETSDGQNAPYDAVVIDYHMPELNAMETIDRLEESFRQNCKICVVSGNTLAKADKSSLDGKGIRFVQKNQSACCKILNLLSSPDLRKCSSCTKWKPLTEFSGKATCDVCRPKKRKQGANAEKNKRTTRDLLQNENDRLRQLVMVQNAQITSLKAEAAMQQQTIARLLKHEPATAQDTPLPPVTSEVSIHVPDTNGPLLDSNLTAEEENITFELLASTDLSGMRAQLRRETKPTLYDTFQSELNRDQRKQASLQQQMQLQQMQQQLQAQSYVRTLDPQQHLMQMQQQQQQSVQHRYPQQATQQQRLSLQQHHQSLMMMQPLPPPGPVTVALDIQHLQEQHRLQQQHLQQQKL